MRVALTIVCLLALTLCALTASAASVTLAWDANTETDLAGYNLYIGTNTRQYSTVIPAGLATTITTTNLALGVTNYFAVTAFNTAGLESDFSNEVFWRPPVKPSAPKQLRITATLQAGASVTGPWDDLASITWDGTIAEEKRFFRAVMMPPVFGGNHD